MKSLFISNTALLGGAELYLFKIVGELRSRDYDVQVIVSPPSSRLASRFEAAGVPVELQRIGTGLGRWKGWLGTALLADPVALKRLLDLLRVKHEEGFRTVVFNNPREQILASRFAKSLGYRVVWFLHSPLYYTLNRVIGYPLLGAASSHVDVMVSEADYLRKLLISRGVSAKRNVIVSNFVDLERIDKEIQVPIERNHTRRVGYIGRLASGKGVDVLLRATTQVKHVVPEFELVIAGEGPQARHLRAMSDSLGLGSVVQFLGFLDNPLRLMASLDVFVNPSHDPGEVLPTNILEAFALERSVVATDHAGIPEIVINGKTGILVTKRDPSALAKGILTLLNDPAAAKTLGMRARSHLIPNYLLQSAVDSLEKILAG